MLTVNTQVVNGFHVKPVNDWSDLFQRTECIVGDVLSPVGLVPVRLERRRLLLVVDVLRVDVAHVFPQDVRPVRLVVVRVAVREHERRVGQVVLLLHLGNT